MKPGKVAPREFVQINVDEVTGKVMGWEPADQSAFAKYLAEAVAARPKWEEGTYELIGPKINGNPENYPEHCLISHAQADERDVPRDYDGLRASLTASAEEGVVWHHPDGRMVKIKRRDFPRETA